MKKLLCALSILIVMLTSCSKSVTNSDTTSGDALKKMNAGMSRQLNADGSPVLNPTPSPTVNYSNALSYYTSESLLASLVNTTDSLQAKAYLAYTVDKIKAETLDKFGLNLNNETQETILLFALFESAKEKYLANGGTIGGTEGQPSILSDATLDCFITTVTSVLTIVQIKNLLADIAAGATEATVIAQLRLLGYRVGGAITVAFLVYEVGHCLDWWYGTAVQPSKTPNLVKYNEHVPDQFYAVNKSFFNANRAFIIDYLVNVRSMTTFNATLTVDGAYNAGPFYDVNTGGSLVLNTWGRDLDDYFHYVYSQSLTPAQ